ncbi:hypothetical protein [Flyfo microvirus Tbat2_105]|nr:hypothetical protein [Flyfo microvirus Tbat2_105]
MKWITNVLVRPAAARLGSLVAGTLSGIAITDPSLTTRIEAWVTAGAFLLADIIVANMKARPMEGR